MFNLLSSQIETYYIDSKQKKDIQTDIKEENRKEIAAFDEKLV